MADLLTGGLLGSVVDKLLTQVLLAASLALQHNERCRALYTLLTRIQPVIVGISSKADAGMSSDAAAAIATWLRSFHKELKEAEEILTISEGTSDMNVMKKASNSKKILAVTSRIKELVEEAALLGLFTMQSVESTLEKYLPELSEQLKGLQQEVWCFELSRNTRNAFHTPTFNYGHVVGITSVASAVSQIKHSADAFNGINSGEDSSTPPAVALAAEPKFRRQDSETVFGGADIVEEMQQLLLSQDEGRRWVGVWATGGAGKTLTAQRLYNSPLVQSYFTGGAFWLTVGRASSVQTLLHALSQECAVPPTPMSFAKEDAKNWLCHHLQGLQKAVLFLDDVWDSALLDWLDVLPASEGSGNRIFVTTRNVGVLEIKHAERRQIPMLPMEDSWKLFCWHAFRHVVPTHLEVLARKVVDECKGLPLALKVIGAAFAGKTDLNYWHRSLEKLKNAEILSQEHEQQLFLRLELSLEDLPTVHPRLRDCFLYFAAFPEDAEVRVVEDLLNIWVGEGIVGGKSQSYNDPEDEVYELLGWLIARSLIELHSNNSETYIQQSFITCKIHDVLRDLARYTLQHKREPPSRECLYEAGRQLDCFPPDWLSSSVTTHSRFRVQNQLAARRLALSFNNLTELPQQLHAPNLQVLLLRDNPLASLPRGFIESFRGLRVLDLRNTRIRELPSTVGNLKLLVSLNLNCCHLLQKIPDSIGQITELRHLDLSNCKMLSSLPSKLFRLTNLQILNLDSSFNVWDGKGYFLSSLLSSRLVLKDLSSLQELTQLNICSLQQNKLSITLSSFDKLRSLVVSFRQLIDLPDVEGLNALQVLNLQGCWSLKSLSSSLTCLINLTTLNLTSCRGLPSLPALDLLPQLEKVDLSGCAGLIEFPLSFARAGAFPVLKELSMYGCDKVAHFPLLEAGAMPQLALLILSGWTQLTSLPGSFQHLKKLQTLDASLCINLQSLDQSLDLLSLSSLEELYVSRTQSLHSLPPALASLPNLKVVDIRNCNVSVPHELEQLKAQGRLKIFQ